MGLLSGLSGQFSYVKDQIPKDPLGFGLREDQKTKTKPELALLQTPPYLIRSELRSQNFDVAKFQEIIPRNTCYGAFFSWNLA